MGEDWMLPFIVETFTLDTVHGVFVHASVSVGIR